MMMLDLYAGMRAIEIAALRIGNVVDENGELNEQVYLAKEQTKGQRERVVYFNKRLRKALQDYIAEQGLGDKRQIQLLRTQSGNGFTADTIRRAMRSLFTNAGISNASSHSCRRTALTTLANKGVSVHVIREIAGHANLATAVPGCKQRQAGDGG
ncbi:site-specific integrase [Congregibacter brevis]|uniref:Site-specific integrase n=1 Tax=Congregibacter brevis TaxID=3081201 RepID=A0ABZ0IAS9_9GAMM|nr:site-specific integrase [Congregibacter sp. IMCC45268]